MKTRSRILLLASLLLFVSVGGIGNIVWQLSHVEQMQDLKAVFHCLILLGLFGTGLIFSILELVRQEIMSPIFQLAAQMARLKELKIDGHRLELTGNKNIDSLAVALNDILNSFQKQVDLYRIFPEASPDMIYLLDRKGGVLFCNLNAAKQWNFRPEEIIGKRQEELFPPDIAERHKQVIQKIFETGLPIFVDVPEKIGERHSWIDTRMIPVLNEDGNVTAVLGISRDITERKKMEERIKQSAEEWRGLFDSIPDFILVLDNDNIITHANFRYAEALNLSPEELIGKKCYEIFHKSDKPCTDCPYELTKKDKLPHTAEIDDPNIKIPLLITTAPIFDEKREVCGAVHIAKDISVLKKAQKETLALSKFPSEDPNPVLRIAKDGEVLYSNKPGLELLANWNVKIGEKVPEKWYRLIKEALESAKTGLQEEEVKGKIFSVAISPILEGGYANLYARNVTELKRLQEEAVKTKEASILEAMIDGVAVVDMNGNLVQCNSPFAKMFGFKSPEEMKGINSIELVAERDVQRVMNAMKNVFTSGITLNFEQTSKTKTGKEFPVLVNASVLKDEKGIITGSIGVVRDITEIKRLQEEAEKTKEATILEAMIDGVTIINMKGDIIQCNSSFAKMFGFKSPEETKGTNLSGLIAERDVQRVMNEVKVRCFESGTTTNFKHAAKDKTGKEFPVLVNASVLKDEKGKIVGTIGVVRDITERKKMEEIERLQSEITKNLVEGVYLVRAEDDIIVYANPKFEKMFGYDLGELIGKNVSIVNAPSEKTPEETKKEILDILKKTGEWHGEVKNIKKDGTHFYCYANVSTFDHPEYGRIFVSVHTDITERKKAEEELKKKMHDLEVFYKATVGRELKMVELKEKIAELEKKPASKS